MKKLSYLFLMPAFIFSMAGCSGNDIASHADKNILPAPTVTVPSVLESSAVITWKAVDNATTYVYSLNGGEEKMTAENTLKISDLTPETTYSFKIKAQKTGSKYFEDSEYSEISFKTTAHIKTYQVATFADDWDTWYYDYNDNNTIKRVYRMYNGAIEREWDFTYNGSEVTVTGKNNYTITLNDKGYVATFINGSDTYNYTYDDDGYMTKVEKNGNIVSNIVIEKDDIIKWSKFEDGVEKWKIHTYSAVPNVGGAHCIYSEGSGIDRWLIETGLFGKASTDCHVSNCWDYSATGSTFTFEYDNNGCIKKECKNYDGYIENYFYTYNVK